MATPSFFATAPSTRAARRQSHISNVFGWARLLDCHHPLTPMPATRSTTKRRRETQNSRQNAVRQDRGDYYKCETCGGLFSRYHSSHKRHIQLCEARNQDLSDKEAQILAARYTPTPEPYTCVSSSTENEFGAVAEAP